jgi:hypothetical protein
VLLAAWLWLAEPAPQIPEPAVRWHAPARCPSADEFAGRFDQLRGDSRLTSSFEFVVVARRGVYELYVAGATEHYEADSCEALAEAALLLVSLALSDPPEDESSPPTSVPSEEDRAREAEDVAPFLRAAGVRRIEALEPIGFDTPGRVMAEVGLTGIVTPRPALDFVVGAGPRGPGWALDFGLIARPIFAAPSPEPSVGARMSSWGALVRACVGGRARRFALAGCVGVDVSAVTARATGPVSDARARTQVWTAVELGPELTVPVSGRVAVVLRASGNWLVARPNFTIAGAGTVCCTHPIGISGRIGVEFAIGERRKPR